MCGLMTLDSGFLGIVASYVSALVLKKENWPAVAHISQFFREPYISSPTNALKAS